MEGLLYNLRVLYVEDEEDARSELSIFLKRRVGKLFTAKDGQEGFEAFMAHKPDLVLTDLKMPVMDGMELIAAIRGAGSNCPVIVISALSDSETIIRTVDLGIVKYVIKPLDPNNLVEHMETLAKDILQNKCGETIVGSVRLLNKESKQELENKLKSDLAYFLKTCTGKGPRNVNLFIKGTKIEVKAFGVLTLFEENLLTSKRNYSLVDYNRKVFYTEQAAVLENKMGETAGAVIKLQEVRPDAAANCDELLFSIH